MSIHDRTLAVIEGFYSAALDETLWPAALRNLTDFTGSQASSFWVLDRTEGLPPRLPTFIYVNFDPHVIQDYVSQIAPLDPTVRYLVTHPQQSIVHDGLVKNWRDKDSRAYADWHERSVETRFRMVGQACVASNMQAGVALHRTAKAGSYLPREIERFAVLHSHLKRALVIASRLSSLGAMQQFSVEWLERNSAGVLLFDECGHLVFANSSAQQVISGGDGICLTAGGLVLASKRDNNRLQSLIAQALKSEGGASVASGGIMRASRPSGKQPYGISVSPVSRPYPILSLFRPALCIVITDPENFVALPVARLQSAFGLTPAEARLAERLAAGEDLRAASAKLKITYGTARTRLAQIFQKTGTRRQGELIRLLLSTLAAS